MPPLAHVPPGAGTRRSGPQAAGRLQRRLPPHIHPPLTRRDWRGNGRAIPFLKAYTVFNAAQIDGLPGHFYATAQPQLTVIERIERVEAFVAGSAAVIEHGLSSAYYAVH